MRKTNAKFVSIDFSETFVAKQQRLTMAVESSWILKQFCFVTRLGINR